MRALRFAAAAVVVVILASIAGAQQVTSADPLTLVLDSLRRDPNGAALAAGDVTPGARTVAPGAHVTGTVASWKGPLVIRGTVDGSAVAIDGDVTIGKGGRVRGDALAVGGAVHMEGGTVDGETRTISAITVGPARRPPLAPAQAMRRSLSLSVACYLVLAMIGAFALGVARAYLDTVAEAMRVQPVRSFILGVLGQVGFAPALTLLIVLLTVTIVGAVVVPFALVGFIIAGAGAVTLGFLAVALNGGQVMLGSRNGDESFAASLQPLMFGLSLFLILWVLGGAFAWAGAFGVALRTVAALLTWVSFTVGLGAVIMTRGGSRPAAMVAQLAPAAAAEHEWQTPTPVTGVAAARRPTPAPRRHEGEA